MFETAQAVSAVSVEQVHPIQKTSLSTTAKTTTAVSAAKSGALQQLAAGLVATSATVTATAVAAIAAITAASTSRAAKASECLAFNVVSATNAAKTTITTIITNVNGSASTASDSPTKQRFAWTQQQNQQQRESPVDSFKERSVHRENVAIGSRASPFPPNSRNGIFTINSLQTGSTTEDLIPPGFLPAEKSFRDFSKFSNASPAFNSTIINESDFPQLGVRWSPSFSAASGGGGGVGATTGIDSPVNIGGSVNFVSSNNGNVGGGAMSMGSSTATSPMVTTSIANIHQQQQTSLQNTMFMRDPMMHMNRPYDEILGKSASNGMYAKVTGASLSRNTVPPNQTANVFCMQKEDFPALPASQLNVQQCKSGEGSSNSNMNTENSGQDDSGVNTQALASGDASDAALQQQMAQASSSKSGIQTHPDGLVTNIPANMLNDQYGMAGLLTFLRTIENDPAIIMLALGFDLTNLGLNLNSTKKNLHETFGGPWMETPCRIQDLEAKVPDEYLTNAHIRDQLPNIKLNKLSEDVLFYLFYNCPGEVYQVAAASELYQRDWRFHTIERVWLTRSPYSNHPMENTGSYEKSSYNIFDPIQWRKIPKDMIIEYKQLEERPSPAIAAGPTPNSLAAPTPQMPPPGMTGNVTPTPNLATARMMGMPMPPLQAHAMATAMAQRQMQQQRVAASVMAPPLQSLGHLPNAASTVGMDELIGSGDIERK